MDHQNIFKHPTQCGQFQIVQVIFIQLPRFVSIWGIFLMLLGNYNPGWRCITIDNNSSSSAQLHNATFANHHTIVDNLRNKLREDDVTTISTPNDSFYSSSKGENDHVEYNGFAYNATCDVIKTCHNIQFNPESSTIITEFGLVCDKQWIASLILTILNAGFIVGSFASGQVSERFGRKAGLFSSTAVLAISSGAAIFSPNWEIYAFFTFFIGAGGFGIISSSLVFTMEFLNSKWRGYMSSRPVATLSLCVLSVVIFLLKSWRYLHAITCVLSSLSLIGWFVVTESPRWLFVNSQYDKGRDILRKIAKRNQTPMAQTEIDLFHPIAALQEERDSVSYSYFDILRSREHVITTVKFSVLMIFEVFIYHALIFGVKSIPGDFYTNAVVSSVIQAAIVLSAGPVSSLTGRRTSGFTYAFLGAVLCLFIVASVFLSTGVTQSTIIQVSAYLAKAASQADIAVTLLFAAEIFPTAIRSVGVSFVNGIACVGGLIAPYVIPQNDDDESFAICFSVMAFCFLLNGANFYLLPETKNGTLKDNLASREKQKQINK